MEQLHQILVILDKPKHTQSALERAVAIARAAGAHLHLVSFCWVPMAADEQVFDTHQRRAIRKSAQAERRRWMDALVLDQGLGNADLSTSVVWSDDIAAWVAEYVTEHRPDLVVKSVHHSRTLMHTPLDWHLLRTCEVPLLLVSTALRAHAGAVLAALDLVHVDEVHCQLGERVLAAARRFAHLQGVALHCVNVVEISGSFEDLEFFDTSKMVEKSRLQARERLEALEGGNHFDADHVHLPAGKVGQGVAAVAADIDAGLLVVGTGARRGIGAALLGGSAEKILGRAPCDVLAVHA